MKSFTGLQINGGRVYGELVAEVLSEKDEPLLTPEKEWEKVEKAKARLLESLQDKAEDPSLKKEEQAIFEAHQMMLEDPEFLEEIRSGTQSGKSATEAITEAATLFSDMLSALDDEYMQARAADIRDIASQLIRPERENLQGKILLKEEIFPSEVIDASREGAIAFLSLKGSATSHASILAKNVGLPFITNLPREVLSLTGTVYVDAGEGKVMSDLSDEEKAAFEEKLRADSEHRARLEKLISQPGQTADGIRRQVSANISNAEDLALALKNGAEGVALFRTEFLFMKETLPTADEQTALYSELAQMLEGKSFVIRTMDLGGDKINKELILGKEENPFLGLRGVRLSFARREIFKEQLKAILRTAAQYPMQMMFPMITNLEDVIEVKVLLEQAKSELTEEGHRYATPKLGVMIEVPSALTLMREFAREVDFVSFGTNDLLQYVSASDRMNSDVAGWYDPYQPGFLRLLALAVREAKGLHVGMCGDLAQNKDLVPFFSALGVEEFGVPASRISRIKEILLESRSRDRQEWIDHILSAGTAAELRERLQSD